MKWEHSLTPCTKLKFKLNVKPNAIKLLEENKSGTLSDINHSKIVFNPPPRVMKIKTNVSGTRLNLEAFAQQRKL